MAKRANNDKLRLWQDRLSRNESAYESEASRMDEREALYAGVNQLRAIVRGQYAQGIGRICMDQLMLDVTGIEDVRVGDEAVFIGRQGDCVIYAEELAENAGTITNELFSRLGARVEGRCFRQEA